MTRCPPLCGGVKIKEEERKKKGVEGSNPRGRENYQVGDR